MTRSHRRPKQGMSPCESRTRSPSDAQEKIASTLSRAGLPTVRTLSAPMSSACTPLSGHQQKEPVACPQCGSESRVKRGLCLSCLLSQGLSEETSMEASQNGKGQNGETLEDVLGEIEVRDADWRAGQLSDSGRDRARRDGRDLSRAATALAPHRCIKTHPCLSRGFAGDVGAFPARSGGSGPPGSSKHSTHL